MEQQYQSLEDVYKSLGIERPTLGGNSKINNTPTATYAGNGQTKEIFDRDEDASPTKIKKKDLYDYKNLNIIREYMTRSKGVEYEDAKDEKLVEDYVDHMRWFNTNSLSTAGEVVFVSKGDDLDKKAAKACGLMMVSTVQ